MSPDRLVDRLCDPGGVEAVLLQDVRGLAMRQERIWQGQGADAAGQAVGGQSLEDRAPEAAGADVVLDREDDRVTACPVRDARGDRLEPAGVDDTARETLHLHAPVGAARHLTP